jgi:hypothetical protein
MPGTSLEVRCLGCETHQTVPLDIIRRPKTTPIHELERYMRCRDCSEIRGYPYKRSHLIALWIAQLSCSNSPLLSLRNVAIAVAPPPDYCPHLSNALF